MKKIYFILSLLLVASIGFSQYATKVGGKNSNTPTKSDKKNSSVNYEYKPGTTVLDFSTSGTKGLLYENGPLVTNPGEGPGGADFSLVEEPNSTYGVATSIAGGFQICDDVLINADSWTIDSMAFFAYQTGSATTPSTITEYHVMIYDGDPSNGGSLVWGDDVTNVIIDSEWSGIYRGDDLTNDQRPIMKTYCDIDGTTLPGGHYWIVWNCAGSGASGPWAPAITISGTPETGNALQFDGTDWVQISDGGGPQGLPFEVYGTEIASSCPFPTNLVVSNITNTSANISWTENGTAVDYEIEYGFENFVLGAGTTESVSGTTSTTLNGLSASSSYDVYIRASCGGGDFSSWFGPLNFTTIACDPSNQCEFEFVCSDSYGDGWNGAYISVLESSVEIAQVSAAGSAQTTNVAICDGESIEFVFVSGSYDDEISFVINDPWGTELFAVADGSTLTDGVAFYTFTSSCTPPACVMPTNLTATTTLTTAELGWTSDGDTWNIEWGIQGFSQSNGTMITGSTENPYNLEGLSESTTYDFYVQTDCGVDGTSEWAGPFEFTTQTDCSAPISVLPYTEDFESGIPCWTIAQVNTTETWAWLNDGASSNGGDGYINIFYDANLVDQNELIYSPKFDLSAISDNLVAKFYWTASYTWAVDPNDNYDMNFVVSTDGTNWTSLWDETTDGIFTDFTYTQAIVDISAYAGEANLWFGFKYEGNDGAQWAVDDFTVEIETGLNTETTKSISVYPNPANNVITVANAENSNIVVLNMVGEVVASIENASANQTIDISNVASGAYFVRVNSEVFKVNVVK